MFQIYNQNIKYGSKNDQFNNLKTTPKGKTFKISLPFGTYESGLCLFIQKVGAF